MTMSTPAVHAARFGVRTPITVIGCRPVRRRTPASILIEIISPIILLIFQATTYDHGHHNADPTNIPSTPPPYTHHSPTRPTRRTTNIPFPPMRQTSCSPRPDMVRPVDGKHKYHDASISSLLHRKPSTPQPVHNTTIPLITSNLAANMTTTSFILDLAVSNVVRLQDMIASISFTGCQCRFPLYPDKSKHRASKAIHSTLRITTLRPTMRANAPTHDPNRKRNQRFSCHR